MTDHQPITKPQAEALAGILHQLRPEWGTPALMTLIGRHKDHPAQFPHLVQAAVTAATRKTPDGQYVARTPAVIYQPGKHWEQPVMEAGARPPAADPCEDHIGKEAHNCASCWADVKVGQRPQTHIGKHYEQEAS